MRYAEWAAFQDSFERLFVSMSAPREMALFSQGEGFEELQTILITDHFCQVAEALSPGGWADHPAPSSANLTLLVGHASAIADLGILTD